MTAKVEELLGMDRIQYQQISMIAQGEFLKLLYAKGKERSEIFRKILVLVIYTNFRKKLNGVIFLANMNIAIFRIRY